MNRDGILRSVRLINERIRQRSLRNKYEYKPYYQIVKRIEDVEEPFPE